MDGAEYFFKQPAFLFTEGYGSPPEPRGDDGEGEAGMTELVVGVKITELAGVAHLDAKASRWASEGHLRHRIMNNDKASLTRKPDGRQAAGRIGQV